MTWLYYIIQIMDKFDFSLILPCYNEAEIFNDSVKRIINTLNQTDYTWEIIFVEDKSKDNTAALIKTALKHYSRDNLSVIFHKKNLGRGQTVIDGFNQAQGKIIGYIDIDLEIDELYLPKFIQTIETNTDVAIAWRVYDFQLWSIPRWLATKGYILLRKILLGLPYKDTEGGYKFFNRRKLLPLLAKAKHQGWFFDTEIMTLCFKACLNVVEIPVAFVRRPDKTSTVRLIPDSIDYLINLIKYSFKTKYV